MTSSALVFNIQKFSVHDGPGIRTMVFLKGCPLKCRWCANPEGMAVQATLAFNEVKCITTAQCSRCINICPKDAIDKDADTDKVKIDREKCDLCGQCVKACPAQAIKIFGTKMDVEQVMAVIEQDELFYASSGGGLTLGGGEPLLHADFARNLLKKAQSYGFETAIETSGYASWPDVDAVFQHCDFIHYDIKILDSKKHKIFTGVDNRLIVSNLEKTCQKYTDTPICVRTPVIPGFNDTKEDIEQIVSFLKKLPGKVSYELLAYHQFGENKYSMVGKENQIPEFKKIDPNHFEALKKLIPPKGL